MTTRKTFKRRIRARAEKTGESFTAARAQLLARADRNGLDDRSIPAAEPPTSVTSAASVTPAVEMPVSDEAITRATGHGWEHWLGILDAWGGATHTHTEIARHVVQEHGVDGWWSQSITVGFERARGLRAKHERPGQGFTVSTSATIRVSVERLSAAALEEPGRSIWLAGAVRQRTLRPGKSGTFDFIEPPSRLTFGIEPKGPDKSQIWLEHTRLPDAAAVTTLRAFWKTRLKELKARLEG